MKKKASSRRPAKELYLSALFRYRRSYVFGSCGEWWILSAKHGLVHPDTELDPYDLALKNIGRLDRSEWSAHVLAAIEERIRPADGDVFEIHAGDEYRNFGLTAGGRILDCVVENPTEGMRFGEQLRFYKQELKRRP